METKKKIERKIEVIVGACENEKFTKMLEKGVLQGKNAKDYLEIKDKLVGYAKVNIKTDDKEFSNYYYVMESGQIIQSGSDVLFNSLENIDLNDTCIIKEVKTKRGHTYVFYPVFELTMED